MERKIVGPIVKNGIKEFTKIKLKENDEEWKKPKLVKK